MHIPGQFGDWDVEITEKPNAGGRKTITIRFTPKPTAPCSVIRLVQTIKTVGIRADGTRTSNPDDLYKRPEDGPDAGKQLPEPVRDAAGEPVYIDYEACQPEPWYGTPALRPADEIELGTPGSLTDTPGGPWDKIKDGIVRIEMTAEVCALCVESGECLGCLHWKMTSARQDQTTPDGAATEITVEPGEHACSETFRKALKSFNRNHWKKRESGTLAWHCPDVDPKHEDGDGKPKNPWGADVPERFRQHYRRTRRVSLGPGGGGNGPWFGNGEEALLACLEDSASVAVKLTWAGYQIRTRPGFVFCAVPDVSAADLAPFVPDDPAFRNDFDELLTLDVGTGPMRALLRRLWSARKEWDGDSRDARVTLIAGLGSESARGYAGSLSGVTLRRVMRALASRISGDVELFEATHYIAANYGRSRPDGKKH